MSEVQAVVLLVVLITLGLVVAPVVFSVSESRGGPFARMLVRCSGPLAMVSVLTLFALSGYESLRGDYGDALSHAMMAIVCLVAFREGSRADREPRA
jgi:hypothetical protein